MAKISNLNDFDNLTSNITSFSHAYMFNVNSLEIGINYVKHFAKKIILTDDIEDLEKEDISYKIDNNEFDDLYIVNPSTIKINTEEITKLLEYMETKSLRENGRRVYIIYGFERLSTEISNKILKFLEEPNDNIYALLMTENMDSILSTIISRCQVINCTFDLPEDISINIDISKKFLSTLLEKGDKTIALYPQMLSELLPDRNNYFNFFRDIEEIISNTINYRCNTKYDDRYVLSELEKYSTINLINLLDITNKLKVLIKQNINLNLLTDRYIIEVTKELMTCKKS